MLDKSLKVPLHSGATEGVIYLLQNFLLDLRDLFGKFDVATSRMAFLDLNLHVLQVATSNLKNRGRSVVQNCTSDTPKYILKSES